MAPKETGLVTATPGDTAPPLTDAGRAAMAALLNPEAAAPAAVVTPAAPASVAVKPEPAPRKATDPPVTKWHVSDGEGRTGIVEAANKDSAKYAFMRQNAICDKQQTWSVSPA